MYVSRFLLHLTPTQKKSSSPTISLLNVYQSHSPRLISHPKQFQDPPTQPSLHTDPLFNYTPNRNPTTLPTTISSSTFHISRPPPPTDSSLAPQPSSRPQFRNLPSERSGSRLGNRAGGFLSQSSSAWPGTWTPGSKTPSRGKRTR